MEEGNRKAVTDSIEFWVTQIDMDKVKDVLEVGIGGDPKPGGNYYLFRTKNYKTLDIDPDYEPDYVDDIQNPQKAPKEAFDVVIMSQTLEHLKFPQAAIDGARGLLRKGGYLIVDCPWQMPYHAEDKFGDYWRISMTMMEEMLKDFPVKTVQMSETLTTALAVK